MSQTIETLGQQHQEVLARLAELEAGMPPPRDALEAFLAYLEGEVARHFTLEEEALFPVLARYPHFAHGPVAVMESEHHEFRALVAGLGAALRGRSGEEPARTAGAIVDLLRGHIAKEDHILFPLAQDTLSPEEHTEVDTRAAQLA